MCCAKRVAFSVVSCPQRLQRKSFAFSPDLRSWVSSKRLRIWALPSRVKARPNSSAFALIASSCAVLVPPKLARCSCARSRSPGWVEGQRSTWRAKRVALSTSFHPHRRHAQIGTAEPAERSPVLTNKSRIGIGFRGILAELDCRFRSGERMQGRRRAKFQGRPQQEHYRLTLKPCPHKPSQQQTAKLMEIDVLTPGSKPRTGRGTRGQLYPTTRRQTSRLICKQEPGSVVCAACCGINE
mmetsp:Transcript_32073/g.57424  ORF Transcript_32073/g.57424 Transcript_32073/m.57424 type:complete len:240 (-) Transcript_32073:11-730(-)